MPVGRTTGEVARVANLEHSKQNYQPVPHMLAAGGAQVQPFNLEGEQLACGGRRL